jgi:hypothetical protein
MINNWINYLKSFGTERYKQYCIDLGKLCLSIGLDWPYSQDITLEEFLTTNKLWYTIYL